MSLSERLQYADRRMGRGEGCGVCRWYDAIPEKDQAEFDAWVNSGLSTSPLYEACRAEGLTVGLSTFRAHLRSCRESQ